MDDETRAALNAIEDRVTGMHAEMTANFAELKVALERTNEHLLHQSETLSALAVEFMRHLRDGHGHAA